MPITKEQARGLAKTFLDAAYALSRYRFGHWGSLTAAQRRAIADVEWTLHNHSDDFTDSAVGLVLDDIEGDLDAIRNATTRAINVVATVQAVKAVLEVAAGLVVLGGAIASQNPSAIAKAAMDLLEIAQGTAKTSKSKAKRGPPKERK